MKVYVVFFKSNREPYMVLTPTDFKQFRIERDMELFEVFKLPEKEAQLFFKENSMDYDSFEGYAIDYNEVITSFQDEEMYNENFSIFTMQYRKHIEAAFEMIVDNGYFKFTDEEYEVIDSYFHMLFNKTIKPEELEYMDPDENIFNEVQLMIDSVLIYFGYIKKEGDM